MNFNGLRLTGGGAAFTYTNGNGMAHNATFSRFLIRRAWERGCDMEDLADGFGPGMGTMNGDWSGIRDSSDAAIEKMLERALNHLFPENE